MSIWTSLEPASVTVDPGSTGSVTLRLRNTTDLVEEYRITVAGATGRWARVEPGIVRLYPGTTGTAEITFAPPRSPDAAAGSHPFAVEVSPAEQSQLKTVVEGTLTLTPFTEVRAELLPQTVRGRFGARPKFAVDNFGNTKVTASLLGKDNGGQLSFTLQPAHVQIEPGRAAWVKGRVRPPRVSWFGSRESHPYSVDVQRSGEDPLSVPGTYVQLAVLPRWLLALFSLFLAGALAFAAAWFAFIPRFDSRTREGFQALNPTGNQVTMPTPTANTPTNDPSDKPKDKPSDKPDGNGGGGGGPKKHKPSVNWVHLVNTRNGGCLDNASDGHSVYVMQCNEGDNQRWAWLKTGGDWRLKNKKNGLCLNTSDDTGYLKYSYAANMVDCKDADIWTRKPDCIRNPKRNACLDNADDGHAVYVFVPNQGDNQRWRTIN
ncbi:ricin-type beta-trefoil lectin domain protein [Actinomadura rupiterrae]|uniref:ricin-type beta-trefoil lectin domain protein n=1 Tax=Actinomadura rupiterrae TaxID=559627 RepID=UPI0020A3ED03|nr:ricin-type beta-trefoil lectin domain protein [Actinomadura rupiterrae]MCP2342454.1 hypothetical protein [Actinomadura rupiterrae]